MLHDRYVGKRHAQEIGRVWAKHDAEGVVEVRTAHASLLVETELGNVT